MRAELDHSFERGLTNVSATYTLRKDGGADVLVARAKDLGFDTDALIWVEHPPRADSEH